MTAAVRDWQKDLKAIPDVELRWHEVMARQTTFRIGGPVACLARPKTESAAVEMIHLVRSRGIPYMVIGGGSNLLMPDDFQDVLVIQLKGFAAEGSLPLIQGDEVSFIANAGQRLSELQRSCLEKGFAGLEMLVGIPGTVGGAVVMNAGTNRGAVEDALVWVRVMDEHGLVRRIGRSQLQPRYRSMGLPEDWVVLGGCFKMHLEHPDDLRARMKEILAQRKQTQPLSRPSAGCIFKNPPGEAAGALIDKVGLKGLRVGGAEISTKHANWIINRGGAKAGDVLGLIEIAEQRVLERFGVRLEREIKVLAANG